MVTCTRPEKDQSTKILIQAEELLAVDSCLKNKNHALLRIWVTYVPVDNPTTMYPQATLNELQKEDKRFQ